MIPARFHVAALLLVMAIGSGWIGDGQSNIQYKKPLAFSCFDEPVLGVYAETLRRDSFVDVELRLVDPLQRSAGFGNHKKPIPRSSYGKVVDDPGHPEKGKAVAVEVCGAGQGMYEMTIWEHTKSAYLIKVRGGDGKIASYVEILYPVPEEGRACRYRFLFKTERPTGFRWFDDEGHALPQQPGCMPMQRASRDRRSATHTGL